MGHLPQKYKKMALKWTKSTNGNNLLHFIAEAVSEKERELSVTETGAWNQKITEIVTEAQILIGHHNTFKMLTHRNKDRLTPLDIAENNLIKSTLKDHRDRLLEVTASREVFRGQITLGVFAGVSLPMALITAIEVSPALGIPAFFIGATAYSLCSKAFKTVDSLNSEPNK